MGLRQCRWALWCWSLLQDFEGSIGEICEVVAGVLNVMIWYSGFVRRSVAKILMDENTWL